MNNPHLYIFIGPEGAGKSTQAKLLSSAIHLPSVSTGDMLRKFAADDSGHLGEAARRMFAKNGYLDAVLINQVISRTLAEGKYELGAILDGSLRTYEETEHFDEALASANRQFPVTVFYIQIPEEESYKRLTYGRQRDDDSLEGVKRRLDHFNTKLQERLDLISQRYTLVPIDGMGKKEDVHAAIMQHIVLEN